MRRLRRGRGKRQKQILVVSTLVLFSILTIGYAAFQTNISLTAKGNVTPNNEITATSLKQNAGACGDGELVEDPTEPGRYVYRGANPCNYLTLNNETWRIISIEADNTIKIMSQEPVYFRDEFEEGTISSVPFDLSADMIDYTKTRYSEGDYCGVPHNNGNISRLYHGCNVWGSKTTMRDSNGSIVTSMPYRHDGDNLALPDDEAYINVRLNGGTYKGVQKTGWYNTWSSNLSSSVKALIDDNHVYYVGPVSEQDNNSLSDVVNREKTYKWYGRVGLISVSDYLKANSNATSCSTITASSLSTNDNLYNNPNLAKQLKMNSETSYDMMNLAIDIGNLDPGDITNTSCYTTNWLSMISEQGDNVIITLTPLYQRASSGGISIDVRFPDTTWYIRYFPTNDYVSHTVSYFTGFNPVLFLTSSASFEGLGSSAQPYTIVNGGSSSQGGSSGGSGGGSGSSSSTVYAWNTTSITVGTSTINDLVSTKTAQPYYANAADVMSASGYTFFNKYTVVNDVITEGYSCQTFGISGFEPVCLKNSTDGSMYNYQNTPGNWATLQTLNSNTTFTGSPNNGSCVFATNSSNCKIGDLTVAAYSGGRVEVYDNTGECYANWDNYANCFE